MSEKGREWERVSEEERGRKEGRGRARERESKEKRKRKRKRKKKQRSASLLCHHGMTSFLFWTLSCRERIWAILNATGENSAKFGLQNRGKFHVAMFCLGGRGKIQSTNDAGRHHNKERKGSET